MDRPGRGAHTPPRRIALIGNSLPRRCGIATFTTDLQRAISNSGPNLQASVVAMTDHDQTYDYPSSVVLQIRDDNLQEYARAAASLNAGGFDVVCLQHEFGIFGGGAGAHILELLTRLTMPVVTTLHTVLASPSAIQRAVTERIVEASAKVVVMADKGRELLQSVKRRSRSLPMASPTFHLSRRTRQRQDWDSAAAPSF
jgi:hypothetical protein